MSEHRDSSDVLTESPVGTETGFLKGGLMPGSSRLMARLRLFKRKDNGSASVEFVLWMPLFMALTILVIDTSVLFTSMSNYWSVSRDTARLVSRHAMTELDAEAYANEKASILWSAPVADVVINGATVTVNLSAPATTLSIFNALGFASTFDINASVTHAMEPK